MLAILFILLIISIKLYIDAPFDIEREFFTYNLIVAFVALLIFMIKKKKIDNPLLTPSLPHLMLSPNDISCLPMPSYALFQIN